MAKIVFEVATDITLPNIMVQRKYADGVLMAYRLTANDGYVMYDTTANDTEYQIDTETGEFVLDTETGMPIEIPVTYYYRQVTYPVRIPVENWTHIAVLESTVDENYIFGLPGNNEHEVM